MALVSVQEKAAREYFQSIPWCQALINTPHFEVIDAERIPSAARGVSSTSLFGDTWYTDATIPFLLVLYRPPSTTHKTFGEMRGLYALGEGLNEHAKTLHGGVIAAILDRAMGKLARHERFPTYTVHLNISYKKPITTPGTIMARSGITKVEGRKVWAYAQIEDGTGEVNATAEGLLLKPLQPLL